MTQFDEAVEFSIRLNATGVWIPIGLVFPQRSRVGVPPIGVGDTNTILIRGYAVNDQRRISTGSQAIVYSVIVCDFDQQVNVVEFRWLQSGRVDDSGQLRDIWSIDDVLVTYELREGVGIDLLQDSFDNTELK